MSICCPACGKNLAVIIKELQVHTMEVGKNGKLVHPVCGNDYEEEEIYFCPNKNCDAFKVEIAGFIFNQTTQKVQTLESFEAFLKKVKNEQNKQIDKIKRK